jgi:hypothetical protein
MELFNLGFWLTVSILLMLGSIPALLGGVITYAVNKNIEEETRLIRTVKVTLVLTLLFSCGICNFWR